MNSTARSLISGTAFFGFLGYFVYAIATQGIASDAALIAFSLMTVHGLVEIAVASYAPAPIWRERPEVAVVAPVSQVTVAEPRRAMSTRRPATAKPRAGRSRVLVA